MALGSKKERPKIVEGLTTRMETGCGKLYVTVNSVDGAPFEIFAHLGKSGTCASCQSEALTRSISLGLRYGIPVEEYVKELIELRCQNPHIHPENEKALSCPDAIARVLKDTIKSKEAEQ